MVSSTKLSYEMDRCRGFLNGADRKWLLLPRDEFVQKHSQQYWGQRRDAVKKRTRDALLDFAVLYEHLGDEHRERLLSPRFDAGEGQKKAEKRLEETRLDRGLVCIMALFIEQRGEERFEEILERAIAHVYADERTPGRAHPAIEGISVELSITHTDTVTPGLIAQKIREAGVDRLSASEQRALLQLLQATGQTPPETAGEFAEIYQMFIEDHYEGEPIDMGRAIITLDPFGVTEGPPNIPAEGEFSDLGEE